MAEVGPALMHHFFGVKDQLFITVLGSALNGLRLSALNDHAIIGAMDGSAALIGVLGAVIGAGASIVTAWLTQRSQLRREIAQRYYGERTRWTNDKREIFREIHIATNDWARLLRRIARQYATGDSRAVSNDELLQVERRFHALLYEAALLCGPEVCDLIDSTEDELLQLTTTLGRSTEYGPAGSPDVAAEAAAKILLDDFPNLRDIRLRLMAAMRYELIGSRQSV
ncbi:MAG TPA: hypothetical protein VF003_17425 [Pseudonocardiaceae bacterium]